MSVERRQGCVKWFDNRKGFGFVVPLESEGEIFVHHSGLNVKDGVFRTLYPGEYVEFELFHDEKTNRDYAVNVTGLKGGDLLCANGSVRLMVRRPGANRKGADSKQ